MMINQRGGILSKVFIIPAGVVTIIAVFILGFYVGRSQERKTAASEKLPALPEVVSDVLPKKEEFTFYKTLTEKGDRTVSVDLKPKPKEEERALPKAEASSRSSAPDASRQKSGSPKEPQAKQTAKKEPATTQNAPSKFRYTVQVASYPDRGQAEDEARSIKKKGYAAFVVSSTLPDKGTWYRVRLGSFANKPAAEKLAKELKSKEGISSFITTE